MRKFLVFSIFFAFTGLGIGIYIFWPTIDEKLEAAYNSPPEEEVFVDDDIHDSEDNEEISANDFIALAAEAIRENPLQSWKYLERALEEDPSNADIRIYRARILEAAGKPSIAQEEYELALADHPESSSYADEYAGFLLRRGGYLKAQGHLNDYLKPPSSDSIWLKSLLLDKLYHPSSFQWSYHRIPKGRAKPLVHYILQLPQGRFWEEEEYRKIPYGQDYLKSEQITYWLRLTEALNQGNYQSALTLLNDHSFSNQSWNPQLEINLLRILNYNLNRSLVVDRNHPVFNRFQKSAQTTTPLTYQLEKLAKREEDTQNNAAPNDVRALLLSREIFTVAFLDTGWSEAAIHLHRVEQYPSSFPRKLAFDFALALRHYRGDQAALDFAKKQHAGPEINLLVAELNLQTDDRSLAINQLHHMAADPGDLGFKASRLLAEAYIESGEFQKAKEFVERTPHFAENTLGQEYLAQIFLKQNQPELVYRIYLNIEKESPKAKAYLAQKAIDDSDWSRARELTEELVAEFPDDELYQNNLKYIRFKSPHKF